MADVRLTATNPEDSSVVPVACDAAGRLLLEEPQVIEGPPGPRGEQGPPGQDGQDGQDGDPFSGNFSGDVTFGGSAEFAGDVLSGDSASNGSGVGANLLAQGQINVCRQDGGTLFSGFDGALSNTVRISSEGSAEFDGRVTSSSIFTNRTDGAGAAGVFRTNTSLENRPSVLAQNLSDSGWVFTGQKSDSEVTSSIKADGSASFAGNKAGFTAEGYLWCTTTRGDTVMLDFTTNGMAQWIPYTPTTRLEEIRDKLDANRGDTGEMPADTP